MRIERCQAPVLDAKKRAKLCGKLSTTRRDVPTGYGDERVTLLFCEEHAAEIDAKPKHDSAPAARARATLLYYFNFALPNGAHAEHAAAIKGIVDDVIDAAVLAIRAGGKGGGS